MNLVLNKFFIKDEFDNFLLLKVFKQVILEILKVIFTPYDYYLPKKKVII